MTEGSDKACMGLNCSQNDSVDRDALIEAVAAAQPRTVVVLQTGGPVLTPWRDKVRGLLEAWYPGQNGGTAIARVLFGDAEPGGPPARDVPAARGGRAGRRRPGEVPGRGRDASATRRASSSATAGSTSSKLGVAYPFGYGLGYTTFAFSDLRLEPGSDATRRASA